MKKLKIGLITVLLRYITFLGICQQLNEKQLTLEVDNDGVKKERIKRFENVSWFVPTTYVDKTKKQSEKANLRISASMGNIKADVFHHPYFYFYVYKMKHIDIKNYKFR